MAEELGVVKIQDVLFQKLGGRWYAFTEEKGEIYYTALPFGLDPREDRIELTSIKQEILEKKELYREKSNFDASA